MHYLNFIISMKKLLILSFCLVLFSAFTLSTTNPIDKKECTYKGVPLWGDVKIESIPSLADFTVKIDDSFPDLSVRLINTLPRNCGEWRIVNSAEDFSIAIVPCFEDISIRVSDNTPPGVR